jgi:SAM-dependent methyltransferase
LAELGHDVLGVDSSADMLARARAKVPDGRFYEADLNDLPIPDGHVDVLVCALALTHLPNLEPVLAEFVRVLRPGGHLVLSDSRGLAGDIGIPLVKPRRDGTFGYMPRNDRLTSDYLRAALALGLQLRRCEEPRHPSPLVDADGNPTASVAPAPAHVGEPVPPDIWGSPRLGDRGHQRGVPRQSGGHRPALPVGGWRGVS